MTIDQTRAILESYDFSAFIGQEEDLLLEVKGDPCYELATARGRIEMSKDVVALANGAGGYLLLGLRSDKDPVSKIERITALALLEQNSIPVGQLEGIVAQHVYPAIEGLEVTWYPAAAEPNKGVLAVYVPPQSETRKWFLLGKVEVDGELMKQIVFGLAIRAETNNQPLDLRAVYNMTQSGKSDVSTRLTRIEEKLDSMTQAVAQTEGEPATLLEERINNIL